MIEEEERGDIIQARFEGPVSGQAAVGKDITQTQQVGSAQSEVTEADLAQLQQMFAQLKTIVQQQAPPEHRDAAVAKIGELQEAVTDKTPQLSTMEYVRDWFLRTLPTLAGAVTSVVINPIVGKVVGAAGDSLASDYRRRFG